LKTSEVRASVGSNPTLSVLKSPVTDWVFLCLSGVYGAVWPDGVTAAV